MNTLSDLFMVSLAGFVSGPIAAVVWMNMLIRKKHQQLRLFWGLLMLVNLALALFSAWPIATTGFPNIVSLVLTPAIVVMTFVFLSMSRTRLYQHIGKDNQTRKQVLFGTIFIPLLQLFMTLLLPFFIAIYLRAILNFEGAI